MTHMEYCAERVQRTGLFLERCDNHESTPQHSHSYFEFVYVLHGRAIHYTESKKAMINEGDYFLIDINHPHQYQTAAPNEKFTLINCMFMPSFLDRTLANTHRFNDLINRYLLTVNSSRFEHEPTRNIYHDADRKILFLIQQMLREQNDDLCERAEILRSFLSCVMIYLVRNEIPDNDNPDIVSFIKNYVITNYARQISLSEICKDVNYSLSNVSLLFSRYMGMSFRDYLKQVRIKKACELLEKSSKSVAEIANLVGYADPAFFYRIFKEIMNVTPKQYRQNLLPRERT